MLPLADCQMLIGFQLAGQPRTRGACIKCHSAHLRRLVTKDRKQRPGASLRRGASKSSLNRDQERYKDDGLLGIRRNFHEPCH